MVRLRVLFVDDEPDLLEQAKLYIEKGEKEINVETESSVEKSLELLKNERYDAIISDYQMSEIDGLEFLRILRKEKNSNIPFIIFTGKGREEVAMKALNLGADQYIQKGGDQKAQYGELKHAIFQAVERHRAQKEIQKSEKRYRKTIENAEIGIVICGSKDNVKIFNSKMDEMLGLGTEDLGNLYSWLENNPSNKNKKEIQNKEFEVISGNPNSEQKEIKITPKEKKDAQFILFKQVILGSDETLLLAQDITENKKIEKILEQQLSESPKKEIIEEHREIGNLESEEIRKSNPEDIKNRLKATKGKLEELLTSQWTYARRMLKFSLASWIFGISIFAVLTVIYFRGFSFLSNALPLVVSFFVGGLAVPIIITAALLGKKRKKIQKLDSMKSNLISNYEKALIASEKRKTKEKEEFLHSLLRHDLKNKIQIIEGYHELLRNFDLPEGAEEYVKKARKASREGNNLIEKIRTLRKVDKSKVDKIDVSSVIRRVVQKYEDQADDEGTKIKYDNKDCEILAGPLLEELFSNLVENSIKHADCEIIKISTKRSPEQCMVVIEDDGKGIPDGIKDRIFDKGFKCGETAGSGIGLALVKKIIESYNGTINFKESELGGSRFEVQLNKPKVQDSET